MAISHGNSLVMHNNQEMDGNQVIESRLYIHATTCELHSVYCFSHYLLCSLQAQNKDLFNTIEGKVQVNELTMSFNLEIFSLKLG